MYIFIRKVLFLLPPELAHKLSLKILDFLPRFLFDKQKISPLNCMGLTFPHRVGLAAGLDKNAEHLSGLAKLGFAFIEVGTVTPRPQSGNPRPRLFRLCRDGALINRMGFNNAGVDKCVMNILQSNYSGILGINIGKNKDTPLVSAASDYIYCMQRVYQFADYITVNISSPNTQELRKLQAAEYLDNFISQLKLAHTALYNKFDKYVPLAIKASPDESIDTLENIAKVALKYKLDAIIATNTSNARIDLKEALLAKQSGGLSGKPILEIANNTLKHIKKIVGEEVLLIGVGGIDDEDSARSKLNSGASLLQVYTGLIYSGPKLIRTVSKL